MENLSAFYMAAGAFAFAVDCLVQTARFGRIVAKWPTLALVAAAWPLWLALQAWFVLDEHLVDPLYARRRATGDRL